VRLESLPLRAMFDIGYFPPNAAGLMSRRGSYALDSRLGG
jgi:hypothetical protein